MTPKADVDVREPRTATGVLLECLGRRDETDEDKCGWTVSEAPEKGVVNAGVVIVSSGWLCVGMV